MEGFCGNVQPPNDLRPREVVSNVISLRQESPLAIHGFCFLWLPKVFLRSLSIWSGRSSHGAIALRSSREQLQDPIMEATYSTMLLLKISIVEIASGSASLPAHSGLLEPYGSAFFTRKSSDRKQPLPRKMAGRMVLENLKTENVSFILTLHLLHQYHRRLSELASSPLSSWILPTLHGIRVL